MNYDGLSKQRIGSKYDGGYVIDRNLTQYDLILSGGAGNNITFEEELCSLLKTKCIIYDHTVDVKSNNTDIVHIKEKLDKNTDSFYKYINIYNNIFLKLDIEGGEYQILSSLDDNDIFKFKQIVIEFHDYLSETRLELIKKLTINHVLIHLHANNCCGLIDFNSIKFPKIVELTFVRKSEITNHTVIKSNNQPLPVISLDYPNLKNKPEIRLDYYPFMMNDVQDNVFLND